MAAADLVRLAVDNAGVDPEQAAALHPALLPADGDHAGRMWDTGLRQTATRGQAIVLYIWAAVPLALGIGLLAAGVHWHSLAWSLAAGVAGATLLVGFALVAWFVKKCRLSVAWTGAVFTVVLFHILLGLWLLPGFEPYRLSRNIAEQVNEITTPGTPIIVSGYENQACFLSRPPGPVCAAEGNGDHVHELAESAVLAIRAEDLQTAGFLSSLTDNPNWHHIVGFNYVKWREETIWIGRVAELQFDDD